MVNISPALEGRIERRARRAFRAFDEAESFRVHRVTGVSKTSLNYRIPRSGKKKVNVVRDDNNDIFIDPPTTGSLDLLTEADLKKLKNETGKLHAGEITAYLLSKKHKKLGKIYTPRKAEKLLSRKQCVESVEHGEHVFVVALEGNDIDVAVSDHITANTFTVTGELDSKKDLGFTSGLLDLQIRGDVESLRKKKHVGRVRAYKYVTKDAKSPTRTGKDSITYVVGQSYEIKDANTDETSACHTGINLADVAWAKGNATGDKRLFAFEFDMDDVAAIPTNTDGKFRVHRCKCVEEIDPKTLKSILKAVETDTKKPKKPKKKKKGLLGKFFGSDDEE